LAGRREEQDFRHSVVAEAEEDAQLVQLDEDAMWIHQIDHGVKSVIHGDHVMSRSDVGNYRPSATPR